MKKYLVLDYGGSSVKYAIMDKDANVYESGKHPISRENLEKYLDDARDISRMFAGQYDGVAVSLPGRIDTATGFAHTGGAFSSFVREIPLGDYFKEIYGKPVVMANDAKCAAQAELSKGALIGVNSGVVMTLGTGVGGGIIVNGKIWMGSTGGAGELSLLVMNSSSVIAQSYDPEPDRRKRFRPDAMYTSTGSTTGLLRLYAKNRNVPYDPDEADGMSFFRDYDNGDEIARKTLTDYARVVAAGICSIQSVLDAEKFAIGGGISARPEVTDEIRKAVNVIIMERAPFCRPEIVTCHFGNEANQIGALMFYLERYPEQ